MLNLINQKFVHLYKHTLSFFFRTEFHMIGVLKYTKLYSGLFQKKIPGRGRRQAIYFSMGGWCGKFSNYMGRWCSIKSNYMGGWCFTKSIYMGGWYI